MLYYAKILARPLSNVETILMPLRYHGAYQESIHSDFKKWIFSSLLE